MSTANYEAIKVLLTGRKEFQGNTMRAENGPCFSVGRLESEYRDELRNAQYVVYSYTTPIAWVRENGEIFHVPRKFSVTTSKHQSIARAYLR